MLPMGSIQEHVKEERVLGNDKPLGIRIAENVKTSPLSYNTYQALVLVVTFFAYTTYHLTRKTTSVIKSALDPNSSTQVGLNTFRWQTSYHGNSVRSSTSSGWAPFNGDDGTQLLGYLDVAFLSTYAISQFFSGQIGDRMNLRVFLTLGMLGTGLFTASFGFAYWLDIHNFYYFLGVQMVAGLFQSSGWPSVVAVVGNWFGKSKRGLIMGIWNAHTSVGNISGSLIASNLLQYGWGWSLVVPGLIIAVMGLIVCLSLPVSPLSSGIPFEYDDGSESQKKGSVSEPLLDPEETTSTAIEENGSDSPIREAGEGRAVGFREALKIPGVANYALCLFFAKLVAYTFLYWLPFYISYTEIGGEYLSSEASGNLSTFFDIGGVLGGILAGVISDYLDARAITAAAFTFGSIPALYAYKSYGYINIYVNGGLMFIAGAFVNGPYALITTAVSADLGTHSSLKGQSRALATVTAIIDGTGSMGAAIGPLLTGYISAISWSAVFTMLMSSALLAGILLAKLVKDEVVAKLNKPRSTSSTVEALV